MPEADAAAPDPKAEFQRMLEERDRKHAAELQGLRDRVVRAETLAEQTKAAPPAEAPKEHSREELQRLVDAGSMTETRRDQILEEQRERRTQRQIEDRIAASREAERRARAIESEMAEYQKARPEAWQEGTKDRAALQNEFDRIVALKGSPADAAEQRAFEVMALRAAFGPPVVETTRQTRETHAETGGGAEDDGSPPSSEIPEKLRGKGKSDLRFHYEQMIARGFYKGWDDPNLKKEMGYVR